MGVRFERYVLLAVLLKVRLRDAVRAHVPRLRGDPRVVAAVPPPVLELYLPAWAERLLVRWVVWWLFGLRSSLRRVRAPVSQVPKFGPYWVT